MLEENSQQVNEEIQKLIDLGWSDFPQNDVGLRISSEIQESQVSYPHESYTTDAGLNESTGIWANWRAREILRTMKDYNLNLIWEVGSGNGKVALPLQQENISVIAIEPLFNGAITTSKKGIRTYLGTLESMKLPSNSISMIGIFDVLEHIESPEALLAEIHRVLKPGGILLLTVPAHQWLYSDYDEAIGHFRRYSKRMLQESLKLNGFTSITTNYLFTALVLPAFVLRRLPYLLGRRKSIKKTISSVDRQFKILRAIEPFLVALLHVEKLASIPLGLSIYSTSEKQPTNSNYADIKNHQ